MISESRILNNEKTPPDNTKSAANWLRVTIEAGGETSGVNFPIVNWPAGIDIKSFAAIPRVLSPCGEVRSL